MLSFPVWSVRARPPVLNQLNSDVATSMCRDCRKSHISVAKSWLVFLMGSELTTQLNFHTFPTDMYYRTNVLASSTPQCINFQLIYSAVILIWNTCMLPIWGWMLSTVRCSRPPTSSSMFIWKEIIWQVENKLFHLSDNNKIFFVELENFLFYGALNLRRAVLSDNRIVKIAKDTFRKMIVKQVNGYDNTYQQKLEEIDLSYNKLTVLDYETFSQLNSLKILYLRGNTIKLRYGLFPLNLKKLDLSYNNITNFTLKQLVNSQLLEELILNGNKLANVNIELVFPEAIFQLMHVHKLELSDCLTCSSLADLLAQFKRTNRNIIVQYETEKLNGSNIFGVACDDDAVDSLRWLDEKQRAMQSRK